MRDEKQANSIFRQDAAYHSDSLISDVAVDRRLSHAIPLKLIVLAIIFLLSPILFIDVSMGISARGIVYYEAKSRVVLAERNGVITWIVSDREPIAIKQGDLSLIHI